MIEVNGDIWTYHDRGEWIAITTNGVVRRDGCAVMGRGVAREAAVRYPDLAELIGRRIIAHGNQVHLIHAAKLFAFPVKHHWRDRADLGLIRNSARSLMQYLDEREISRVYSVRPGCGNGGLTWDVVKLILDPIFDDRITIVERNHGTLDVGRL